MSTQEWIKPQNNNCTTLELRNENKQKVVVAYTFLRKTRVLRRKVIFVHFILFGIDILQKQ